MRRVRVRVAGSRRDAAAAAAAAADTDLHGLKCALCVLSLFVQWGSREIPIRPVAATEAQNMARPFRPASCCISDPPSPALCTAAGGGNPSGLLCHSHQAQQTSPSSFLESSISGSRTRTLGSLEHSDALDRTPAKQVRLNNSESPLMCLSARVRINYLSHSLCWP